jgi:hypothetical protein
MPLSSILDDDHIIDPIDPKLQKHRQTCGKQNGRRGVLPMYADYWYSSEFRRGGAEDDDEERKYEYDIFQREKDEDMYDDDDDLLPLTRTSRWDAIITVSKAISIVERSDQQQQQQQRQRRHQKQPHNTLMVCPKRHITRDDDVDVDNHRST